MKFRKIILFFCLTLLWHLSFAQDVVRPMSPPRLVNDFAGIIDSRVNAVLEDSLVAFAKATSTQIVVVTVSDLDSYDAADYALQIGRQWGVGQKNKNNGIVILVKPRNKYGKGDVYIAVGDGLEGVLNDAKAGRLIDKYMLPYLKKGDYSKAIATGTLAVMGVVRGEFTADESKDDIVGLIGPLIMFLGMIFVFIIIAISNKKRGNGDDDSNGGSGSFFPPIIIGGLGGMGGGHSSSGGGFGGFGGFGGGGFSGGGAGRSF